MKLPILEWCFFWGTYHSYGALHASLSHPMQFGSICAHEVAVLEDPSARYGNGYYLCPWGYQPKDPWEWAGEEFGENWVRRYLTGREHCDLDILRTSGYRHLSDPDAYKEIMRWRDLHSDKRGPSSRARRPRPEWPHDWRQR